MPMMPIPVATNGNNNKDNNNKAFCLARLLALPDGYCKGAMPNVLAVSKTLKIGHCETLYLRIKLGKEKFNQLLLDQGIL